MIGVEVDSCLCQNENGNVTNRARRNAALRMTSPVAKTFCSRRNSGRRPSDQGKCVYIGYHLSFTLISCARNSVGAALNNTVLECLEMRARTRIHSLVRMPSLREALRVRRECFRC